MQPKPNARLSSQAMAFVLAGGRGSRLKELTDLRAKPAVYFGGKTRIIDFALSNALNSGIRKMAIATQYKAHSLIRHMQRGWGFFRAERNEYLDILPASQRVSESKWYLGTADAVTQNIDIVDSYGIKYVVILAGDHIYKMDYEIMLQQHVSSGADVTIGCLTVPRMEAVAFGVMAVDQNMRITDFLEKPKDPPSIPGDPDNALASMGIRPGYASVYDMSPDGFPIVDTIPGIAGLYVAAGTSGHGFKLSAGIGRLVADLVTDRPTPLLDRFRFGRDFGPTGEISS